MQRLEMEMESITLLVRPSRVGLFNLTNQARAGPGASLPDDPAAVLRCQFEAVGWTPLILMIPLILMTLVYLGTSPCPSV